MAELTMNLPSLNRARHDGETKQADAATDVSRLNSMRVRLPYFLKYARRRLLCNPRNAESSSIATRCCRRLKLPSRHRPWRTRKSRRVHKPDRKPESVARHSQRTYKALSQEDAGSAQLERAIGAALPDIHPAQTNTDIPELQHREEKQMTANEKKLFVMGTGTGLVAAVLAAAILIVSGHHTYAAETTSSASMTLKQPRQQRSPMRTKGRSRVQRWS